MPTTKESKTEKKNNNENKTEIVLRRRKFSKRKGSSALRVVIVVLIIVLAIGLMGGFQRFNRLFSGFDNSDTGSRVTQNVVQNAPLEVPPSVQAEEDSVVQVVSKASPAVVSIIITKDVPKIQNFYLDPFGNNGGAMPGGNSFFDQFFGSPSDGRGQQPGGNAQNQGGGTIKQEIGGGTGFVVSEDGLIVTNKHVVSDSSADYTVMTNDGREYDAKVLGRDRANDVAVIKVDPSKPKKGDGTAKMSTIPLGDSGQVKIGQTVIAIGNALGEFSNTVSKGIVSGLRRNIVAGGFSGSEQLDQLIQTDAAINEGNSGGPLLNLRGEVIGINVAMAQGDQRIGFALPIDLVKNTVQSVEKTGKLSQPYLGVRYQVINQAIKDNNNLPFNYGALVLRGQNPTDLAVMPGSPADKAGIQENDIILEINGTKIEDNNDLAKAISGFQVGSQAELKVWHRGQANIVKVTLEEAPVNAQ